MVVTTITYPVTTAAPPAQPSYARAHWYFLAAFAVVVAGFWPTFYRPLGAGSAVKNIHGVTASLWYFVLMAQSWLMSRGLVTWHRRVARSALVLLPILAISALTTTSRMLTASLIPPPVRPIIAFIDFQSVAQLCVLVGLGLLNRRTPPAHKRYLAATALVGFPPALARLYDNLGISYFGPIHTPLITVNGILLVLMLADWSMGEKARRAYPLLLSWNVAIQLLIMPLSATSAWLAFCRWFAS
jgi:uncharacterized membrane protein YozB (DUF420 family)